jgi:hypothetical protein
MEAKEALSTIIQIVNNIEQTDTEIIKNTNQQKIVLLNLSIENARIKELTGIKPIIDVLDKSITNINISVKNLIDNNRGALTEALTVLNDYIEECEKS